MLQYNSCSSMISYYSFRFTSCSTSIENIKGMTWVNKDRSWSCTSIFNLEKVMLPWDKWLLSQQVGPLEDDLWNIFSVCKLECLINYGFIINYFIWFFTSICTYYQFWIAINNSVCQLVCWEASEDHNMGGSYSSTSKNCDYAFDYHRHVDDNPISSHNLKFILKRSCHGFHPFMKFRICYSWSLR